MEVRPGYKQSEVGVIPEDWDAVRIGELFTFKNGLNKAKQFFGHGTPIVNYMDVFSRPGLRTEAIGGCVDVSPKELNAYEVRKGDVFFTRTSETVEEIGIAAVMLDESEKTVYSGFVLRARPIDESLDDLFKAYCFSPRHFRQQVTARASYTTRALTNGRSLSAALLARPPKPEQRAIAAALSDVDVLLGGLHRLMAKKRDLKQAAMQQLLSGQSRLPGFSGEWDVESLDGLTSRATGVWGHNVPDTRNSRRTEIIRAGDISQDGKLAATATRYVSPDEFEKAKCSLDDLVITTSGNGLGKLWWCDGRSDIAASNFVRVLHPIAARTIGRFLYYALRTGEGLRQLQEHTATSAYPNLRPTYFSTKWIPLPLPPEQKAIAAVLSDMDAELAALEARRDKTRDLKQAMMQELLTGKTRLVKPEAAHA
jgi:type I restriction enzyme, S subunit